MYTIHSTCFGLRVRRQFAATFAIRHPHLFSEPPLLLGDPKHVLQRMKVNKGDDDSGLVAEFVKHAPDRFRRD